MIMHKTNAHWESGAVPTPDLVSRVGGLIAELSRARILAGAEGLRASSQGVRVTFENGAATVRKGPLIGENELPERFSILRVESVDAAVAWAERQAAELGDGEVDIRPVTEPWDIGLAPPPEDVTKRRYMVLRKATPASEAGASLSSRQRTAVARLVEETSRSGVHLASETLRPSRRGRRYKNSINGVTVTDGPFTESKEMIGGYVILIVDSRDQADGWARRYLAVVDAEEVDLRELDEPATA
jgi:hypothetical protein